MIFKNIFTALKIEEQLDYKSPTFNYNKYIFVSSNNQGF